jgi:hypothetical protein
MMYEELLDDLRRRREQAQRSGGKLDLETESAIAGELTIYWNQMSEDERHSTDRFVARFADFAL